MSDEYRQKFKKSAQGGTTVTLVPDDGGLGEGRPLHLAATQIVLTFAATSADFWGAAAGDGRKYEVIVRPQS